MELQVKMSVPEVVELIKEIKEVPARIFEYVGLNIKSAVSAFLTNLMECELTHHLGRERYERKEGSHDYRNGSYTRTFCIKGIGDMEVKVPRDRDGDFKTEVIPKSKRYEERITEDIASMYLAGISTRTLSLLSKRLIGRSISHEEVSNASKELKHAIERWRTRDLSHERIKYMFIDGVNLKIRIGGKVEIVPILVVIGVREDNTRCVLSIQMGDKESASVWRECLRDLKARGLDTSCVILGIMDGLKGLETVFTEEFPNAKIQRCQVHVARNVLAKVPHVCCR